MTDPSSNGAIAQPSLFLAWVEASEKAADEKAAEEATAHLKALEELKAHNRRLTNYETQTQTQPCRTIG